MNVHTIPLKSYSKGHNVYWLGGSPCAGKTTVAQAIAHRLGWDVYHCDEHYSTHLKQATPEAHPIFYQLSHLQGDALWLRPVAEQIRTEIAYCAEQFTFALADLQKRLDTQQRPLLFEGVPALPHLLTPLLPTPNHAFYLIPTEPFQRHHYAQREWVKGVVATASNPNQAFDNWMARDAGFARWLQAEITHHQLPWLSVNGTRTINDTVNYIINHFTHPYASS